MREVRLGLRFGTWKKSESGLFPKNLKEEISLVRDEVTIQIMTPEMLGEGMLKQVHQLFPFLEQEFMDNLWRVAGEMLQGLRLLPCMWLAQPLSIPGTMIL